MAQLRQMEEGIDPDAEREEKAEGEKAEEEEPPEEDYFIPTPGLISLTSPFFKLHLRPCLIIVWVYF